MLPANGGRPVRCEAGISIDRVCGLRVKDAQKVFSKHQSRWCRGGGRNVLAMNSFTAAAMKC